MENGIKIEGNFRSNIVANQGQFVFSYHVFGDPHMDKGALRRTWENVYYENILAPPKWYLIL